MMNSFKRIFNAIPSMLDFIDLAFLSEKLKEDYKELIIQRKAKIDV